MSLTHATDRLEVISDDAGAVPTIGTDTQPEPVGSAQGAPLSGEGESTAPRPTFTITDAATACSVSRKTITRKLPELASHGAAKDDDGVWHIPVEALLAVGLHPGRSLKSAAPTSKRPVPGPTPSRAGEADTVTVPRDRWDDLRIRLARAEAEASERALALADARLALRALTAGPAHSSAGSGAAPATAMPPGHQSPAPGAATAIPAVQGAATPATPMPAGPSSAGFVAGPSASEVSVAPTPTAQDPAGAGGGDPDEVVAARNLAARTGGYVPAAPAPTRKRRWWHSS